MALTKNVGSVDQALRILAGVFLLAVSFLKLGGFASTGGLIALIVGVVLVLTAVINFCPMYRLINIRTTKKTG